MSFSCSELEVYMRSIGLVRRWIEFLGVKKATL